MVYSGMRDGSGLTEPDGIGGITQPFHDRGCLVVCMYVCKHASSVWSVDAFLARRPDGA